MENTLYTILPNGIKLYINSWTKTAQDWAVKHWGIKDARVFLTEDAEEKKTYLFVIGQTPEYESENYEAFVSHIDAYGLAQS